MANYPKSAYGSNPNAGKSPNGAQGRGWGTGWPNCQASKIVKVVSDAGHTVNVRREIGELVKTLFQIQVVRGYDPNPTSLLQTWGFACRAIANTKRASNHSWGLAIDNRATENPYSTTFRSTIPPKVVNDWEACGFYWGGRYTTKYDTMHFEYIGTPAQVAGHLAKAKSILKSLTPTVPPVTPPTTGDWFDMATEAQLEALLKKVVPGIVDARIDAYFKRAFDVDANGTFGKNHQALVKEINQVAAEVANIQIADMLAEPGEDGKLPTKALTTHLAYMPERVEKYRQAHPEGEEEPPAPVPNP